MLWSSYPRRSSSILLAGILVCLGITLDDIYESYAKEGDPYEDLRVFADVLSIVQKNYVDDVENRDLIYGAIQGMLDQLDPHSSFLPPEFYKELQVETKGSFGGLGIEITIRKGILTVVSPIEDTPAFEAGIQAGDMIVMIEDESTKGMSLMEAVKRLRGEKGTDVTISVMREDLIEPIEITITRDIIKIQSVKHKPLEDGYGYVRLTQFQENTDEDMSAALTELEDGAPEGLKGLLLDLRNNPGGLLDQAVKVSDEFLDSGLIVYTDGRMENQHMEFDAQENEMKHPYPIVVLINKGSASASEIVAGALQDHERAIILGTRTFGKASVQTIIPLDDGSGLRLTTAKYFTPKGRDIQDQGIEPDIFAPLPEEEDEETEQQPEAGEDVEGNGKEAEKDESEEAWPANDPQIQTALDLLNSWDDFENVAATISKYKEANPEAFALVDEGEE